MEFIKELFSVNTLVRCFQECYTEPNEAVISLIGVPRWSGSILKADRSREITMYMEEGNAMEIEDLSAGYQCVLNLVIDLAYRMCILNPDAGDEICLSRGGGVLIDEIDSGLHPKWQWRIVEALTETLAIIQTPGNGFKSIVLPKDTKKLRILFDKMPKDEIRKALCIEQHGDVNMKS